MAPKGHSTVQRLHCVQPSLRKRGNERSPERGCTADRSRAEATDFLIRNLDWVSREVERAARIRAARALPKRLAGELLFLGETVTVEIRPVASWRGTSRVSLQGETIRLSTGPAESTARIGKALEGWLRRQAKARIETLIYGLGGRLDRAPNRVYVMDQRTKWGNCSGLGNLSFNWRLIMAPDYVLRYMVTDEMVHLAIPDHSRRFWLTVQSLCPDSERARQWLVANAERLMRIDYAAVCSETLPVGRAV
jgi:predicted metal-dependent hydrolase